VAAGAQQTNWKEIFLSNDSDSSRATHQRQQGQVQAGGAVSSVGQLWKEQLTLKDN